MGNLITLPISAIKENPIALRAVNRDDENYHGLIDSIKSKGFMGAITVRPKTDKETGEEFYELVDGLHRFSAAKDAGLEMINVDVVALTDDETLEAQIMANIHKIETRPVEYSRQLIRLLSRNPLMTESELAAKLGKSPQWIKERLGLTKIDNENIATLVNEGKIGLSNAYSLAKLPSEEMTNYVDQAMTLPPDEFIPIVNARIKEVREARRKGGAAAAAVFEPVAFMQKMKAFKDELENPEVGLILCEGLSNPAEGFAMAIQWALHMDPQSVAAQKAKDDERKAQRDEANRKRAAETAKKKAEKAAEAAAAAEEAQDMLSGNDVAVANDVD